MRAWTSHFAGRRRRSAFTLVELLVVIGIIAVLIGFVMPAVTAANREARTVKCQSNIRQLALAMSAYLGEYRQKYPPNISSPSPGQWWYEPARVGNYVDSAAATAALSDDSVWVCPNDEGALRSYSMNYWASSKVDKLPVATNGLRWNATSTKDTSKLLLLVETWSSDSTVGGFVARALVGIPGKGGQRFGGGGGIAPAFSVGRHGKANCELTFVRHRRGRGNGERNESIGRIVVAFADSHVELLSNTALVDFDTGALTKNCVFSPFDLQSND